MCSLFFCTLQNIANGDANIQIIELYKVEKIQKDKLEIFDLVVLETTSENLMGNDLRIRSSNDHYFVFDEAIQDCVHQFDKSGKYIGRRAIVSEGPNTIYRLNDFFVSSDIILEVFNSIGDHGKV